VERPGVDTKTENAERQVDIDPLLAQVLRAHVGGTERLRVFQARNGSPLSDVNVRNRVLHPILAALGIPRAGLHAFRHSRVTMLRKSGTPAELQTQWIGHSNLKTTDRYSHTDEELEYRRQAAARVGLDRIVGPNLPSWTQPSSKDEEPANVTV
jgi:integrase